MPRKKRSDKAVGEPTSVVAATSTVATLEQPKPAAKAPADRPEWIDGPPVGLAEPAEQKRNWGEPYKAIFTSAEQGFELGENRRFKQLVFKFKERPDDQTIQTLKDNGFTYRPAEHAWTDPADPISRALTDKLAIEFAGTGQSRSR